MFQLDVFYGFHELLMMSINLSNIAILNIHGFDYRCFINGFSKREVMSILKTSKVNGKSGTL